MCMGRSIVGTQDLRSLFGEVPGITAVTDSDPIPAIGNYFDTLSHFSLTDLLLIVSRLRIDTKNANLCESFHLTFLEPFQTIRYFKQIDRLIVEVLMSILVCWLLFQQKTVVFIFIITLICMWIQSYIIQVTMEWKPVATNKQLCI